MRRLLCTAMFAAGCFTPRAPSGVPCSPDDTCPEGQMCVAGTCLPPGTIVDDAPVDTPIIVVDMPLIDAPDAAPIDRDNDQVFDQDDNCPDNANTDQHDEDGDLRGDACDLCPHLSDLDANMDGDGVGDACDPHPSTPGDQIAFFDPFVTQRPEWTFDPDFSVSADQLHLPASDLEQIRMIRASTSTTLGIGGTVTWAGALPNKISLTYGTASLYHYCEWYDDGPAKASLTRYNGSYSTLDQVSMLNLPNGRFTLLASFDTTALTGACSMKLGGRNDSPSAATPTLVPADRIEIEGQNATIAFDYFIQISSP